MASLETSIPGMIQNVINYDVTPLITTIDALATRITMCKCDQGATKELITLKSTIDELRKDVEYLKSTNMSMIFGTLEIPDMLEIPQATTGQEYNTE